MTKPIVWSVAGSDSGGGAGIQADVQAIQATGAHACTVISAITAQNSVAVTLIEPTREGAFSAQLKALADDLPPAAIKIGMLAYAHQAQMLVDCIGELKRQGLHPWVIWDPVLVASSGAHLGQIDFSQSAFADLLALTHVLTPNLPELAALTQLPVSTFAQQQQAVQTLLVQGAAHVLVKGGHADDALATDTLFSAELSWRFSLPKLVTPHVHGTGCTLSSALASFMAQGYVAEDAICLAKAYVQQGLAKAEALGKGAGPVGQGHFDVENITLPEVSLSTDDAGLSRLKFAPINPRQWGLYPVLDSSDWVARVLQAGVRCVQLRIKAASSQQQLRAEIRRAVELGKQYKAMVFINDHWQLAIELGAYGVHLGQEDLARADLHAIAAAGLRLGISTHGYAELLRAKALKPSYLALGHIYPTQSKQMPSAPQGLKRLANYVSACEAIPTVAIGGISLARVDDVLATGVGAVAMITAITLSDDPDATIHTLLAKTNRHAGVAREPAYV